MARSHLARFLRQAYHLAAQASTAALNPQKQGALTVKTSCSPAQEKRRLLNRQPLPTPALPHQQGAAPVLVVGAGLAGLVVSYRLQQAGIAVDLIEGRDRIGGRILSLTNTLQTGLTTELGGEVFDSAHACVLSLAAELGLPLVDTFELLPERGQATYFFEGRSVDLAELVSHFTVVVPVMQGDVAVVQSFLQMGTATPRVQALDRLSVSEYLASIGASRLLQSVVNVAYTIRYGLDAEEQSCLNLLAFIRPRSGVFNLFGLSDERYFLRGGNDQLARELAQRLTNVEIGTAIEALRQLPDGRYRVSLRQGQGKCDRTYERVVLTVPFNLLRHLSLKVDLPPRQRQAIETLGYNSPTKIITAYSHKRWRVQPQNNGLIFTDLPMQHAWESSGSLLSPGAGLLTHYLGGRIGQRASHTDLTAQTAALVSDLDCIFPGLAGDRLGSAAVRSDWLSDEFSQGAYSCYRVGQWTALHGSEGQRVGNLFFAGEHCSRDHQGYMEGACETAEAVALDLLADLESPLRQQQQQRLQRCRLQRLAVYNA